MSPHQGSTGADPLETAVALSPFLRPTPAPVPSTTQMSTIWECNPWLPVFPFLKITPLWSHTLVIFFKFTEAETDSMLVQWANFSQFLLAERVDKPDLRDCLRAPKALHHTRYLLIALFDDLAKQQQEADSRERNLIPVLVIHAILYLSEVSIAVFPLRETIPNSRPPPSGRHAHTSTPSFEDAWWQVLRN